ncbi:MAG: response regulator transcription factor [Anaerolineae bacterium]|nr:response regulator transcription factor [Anaerolineae bacterium]
MYNILVVDNDIETVESVDKYLTREGYQVARAYNAREALMLSERDMPSLFLINTAIPGDGLALCRRLRANVRSANVPILFLTETRTSHSIADALEVGGDDIIRKPFALRELAARVRAHLRRVSGVNGDDMPMLRILPDRLTVVVNDRPVVLTQVEFELLSFLCSTPDQLHSTHDLLHSVWRYPAGTGDAALVRNHIRNLRRKVELDPERPSIIQSRHGRGYAVRARVFIDDQIVASPR